MTQTMTRENSLILKPGEYLPETGQVYPTDDPYARLVPAPIKRHLVFDASYPYLDDSAAFKFQRFLAYCLVFGPYQVVNYLKYGVRFEGREILRKYKRELKKGAVSVSNHCYRWDGMAVSEALRRRLWIPMLSDHFNGPDMWHLKYFGGIPLPDGSYGGQKAFNDAFDTHNSRREWIHVFPEARNWAFYKPLRPFKKGAFTMAYKYNVPIIPIGLTYRKRTGIHKLFGRKEIPLITVKIGEPIFPDKDRNRKEEVARLLHESFNAVLKLNGIEQNPWPETWNC